MTHFLPFFTLSPSLHLSPLWTCYCRLFLSFPPWLSWSTFHFYCLFKGCCIVGLLKTRLMRAKGSSDRDDITQSVGAFLSHWIRNRREEWRITSEWVYANSPSCCCGVNPHSRSAFGGTSRAFPMFMRLLNEADDFSRETSCLSSCTVTALNTNQPPQLTKVPQWIVSFWWFSGFTLNHVGQISKGISNGRKEPDFICMKLQLRTLKTKKKRNAF